MFRILLGIFIILHGMVHVWYVILSYQLIEYQPDMGWTGRSWLLSGVRSEELVRNIAGILFIASAIFFVISGISVLANMRAQRMLLMISSLVSTLVLVMFWDGRTDMLVQKGIIGVIINIIAFFTALIFL